MFLAGLIEFLNTYMNLSLLLISCEESWEIKFVGVKLLIETIKVRLQAYLEILSN